ncbi:MAG: hypothetical protein ACYS99_06125 [Planctomycetota bacterium]|jgi:hypothetical protein
MSRRPIALVLLAALLGCADAEGPGRDDRLDVGPVLDLVPDDPMLDTWPNPAYERLLARKEEGPRLVDPEEFGAAVKDLALVQRHLERLQTDRNYQDRVRWAHWVRLHPLWVKLETGVVQRPPWLVFYEVDSEKRRANVRRNAEFAAEALRAQYEAFHADFGEPLDLPDLRHRARPQERVLKAFLFARRRSFDEVHRKAGLIPLQSDIEADYFREDGWTLSVAESEVNQRHLLHAGACQLYDAYRRIRGGDSATRSLLCFEEGLIAMLSWAERREDGTFRFLVPAGERLRRWKWFRDMKYAEWTLPDLLGVRHDQGVRRKGMEIGGITGGHMGELFYTESWSFCQFLWFFRDGKYRQRFLDRLACELQGSSVVPDWAGMEPEWRGYVAGLEKELGIK